MTDDDDQNNLIVAGAVLALLQRSDPGRALASIEVVTDADGDATNQIDITLSFMKSPYRITVERVVDADGPKHRTEVPLMPYIIMKATKDRDLYCDWSTLVDAPIFIGTRAEMLDHLNERRSGHSLGNMPEDRLERVDRTGTSDLFFDPPDGSWEDEGFVYLQQGWLPRARLAEFLDRYLVDPNQEPKVDDLLDPLEE